MIFTKFLFFTKDRHSVQMEVTGIRHKNQLGEIYGFSRPPQDLLYYEDYLKKNKKWETFGSYEKFPWIKIGLKIPSFVRKELSKHFYAVNTIINISEHIYFFNIRYHLHNNNN